MRLKVFGALRTLLPDADALDVTVDAGTSVLGVMERVAAIHPRLRRKLLDEEGQLNTGITILVNGRSIAFLEGPRTLLTDSDVLALFPPLAGG